MRLRDRYHRHDDGLVQRARGADILTVARDLQPRLKRSSSEWNGPCPAGCAKDNGFTVNLAKQIFLCRPSRASGDVIAMTMHALNVNFVAACEYITGQSYRPAPLSKAHDDRESDYARRMREGGSRIWEAAAPLAQTLGEPYLRSRAITCPLPASLRFLSRLEHWPTRQMLPAIVARVVGVDSAFTGVHLTFLTPDGRTNTSLGDERKLMLGPTRGSAVRLKEPAEELMIAEGIETALSVMDATGCPTWAALTTSRIMALELPSGVAVVTIAADGDAPGAQAADSAAKRWRAEGRRVLVRPAPQGMDFNDIAMAHARGEAVASNG